MQHDRSLQVERKLYHLVMGLVCFGLYQWLLDRQQALIVLCSVGLFSVVLDLLRLRVPALNRWLIARFSTLLRPAEHQGLTGHSFFVLGMICLVFLFEKPTTQLALLFLSVGDPVASYVGGRWGRVRVVGSKTVEGALAGFVANFAVAMLYIVASEACSLSPCIVAAAAFSLAGTLSELVPLPVDDNLSIPVLSGVGISVLWPFFHL